MKVNRPKVDRRLEWFKPRSAIFVILVLILGLLVSTGAAQENSDDALASQLEARVLSTRVLADGSINTVVEIPVQQDTYVTSALPNTNWGSSGDMRIGYSQSPNYGAMRILAQFNIAAYVPIGSTVNSAILRSYMSSGSPAGDQPMGFEARYLNSAWNSSTVTWNSHQPAWGSVAEQGEITITPGWKEANVTNLVRPWVSGDRANYGLIYIGDESIQQRDRIFFQINANNGLYPRMVIDYTFQVDNEPPIVSVNALPSWSQSSFTVSWSGTDPGGSGIAYYDVQYQQNNGSWVNWRTGTTSTSSTFNGAVNGSTYGFRARGVDNAGNVQDWSSNAQASTKIDSVPPSSAVNGLPQYTYSPNFVVTWGGSDNSGGSGLKCYDLQYQIDGGDWHTYLTCTVQTSVQATGGENGVTYGFRVRATDNAGNVESWSSIPEASTTVSTAPPDTKVQQINPAVTQALNVGVNWVGMPAPGTTIVEYNVQVRFKDGPWTPWQTSTTATSATYTFPVSNGDGVYSFEANATDSQGRTEPFTGTAEAFVIVDNDPPFIDKDVLLPIMFSNGTP